MLILGCPAIAQLYDTLSGSYVRAFDTVCVYSYIYCVCALATAALHTGATVHANDLIVYTYTALYTKLQGILIYLCVFQCR